MNICGHIIKKSEIVGIGPLMVKGHPDQTVRMLYNDKQLLFSLHLKNCTIEIDSPWFRLGDGSLTEYKEAREKYDAFKAAYELIFSEIKNMLENAETNS